MPFRWPNTTQRTLVVGSNGTGKSILASYILANQPIDKMPWIIFDFKTEEVLNAIPYRKYIDFGDVPKEPGIYILPCEIVEDNPRIENFLGKIHRQGRTGLFFDEGYMMPHDRPFRKLNAIYTQGRSKHIPTITLTQRPVQISRFAVSEANHLVYMRLNDTRDKKKISEIIPETRFWNLDVHPAKFHSKWYDQDQNESFSLLPCPKPDDILTLFEDRLRPRRKVHL